jgi:hypothetical protein
MDLLQIILETSHRIIVKKLPSPLQEISSDHPLATGVIIVGAIAFPIYAYKRMVSNPLSNDHWS